MPSSPALSSERWQNKEKSLKLLLKEPKNQTKLSPVHQITSVSVIVAVDDQSMSTAAGELKVTFDYGIERFEAGENLTEPEREWLHVDMKSWLAD